MNAALWRLAGNGHRLGVLDGVLVRGWLSFQADPLPIGDNVDPHPATALSSTVWTLLRVVLPNA